MLSFMDASAWVSDGRAVPPTPAISSLRAAKRRCAIFVLFCILSINATCNIVRTTSLLSFTVCLQLRDASFPSVVNFQNCSPPAIHSIHTAQGDSSGVWLCGWSQKKILARIETPKEDTQSQTTHFAFLRASTETGPICFHLPLLSFLSTFQK